MATITTSTQAQNFSYPSSSYLDRSPSTGRLVQIIRNTGGSLQLYYSTNNGGSWTASHTFFRANVVEWSGIFIDTDGFIHFAYRVFESGRDTIYYRRADTDGWSSEVQLASQTAAVSGAVYQGLSCIGLVFGNHQDVFIAVGTTSGANIGVTLMTLSVKWINDWWSGGYWRYSVVNLVQGTNQWFMPGSGRVGPSLDFRHNGDGHNSSVPEIWISFGRTQVNVVKVAYSNGRWIGPTTSTTVATATTAQDACSGRFDGQRFLMPVLNGDRITVYERDISNTVTQIRTSPVHTTGVVKHVAVNYTASTGDFRLYAVGTSTNLLYFIDYVRGSNSWGSWSATTKTIINANNFGTRRGSYGNARYDYYAQTGSSPYTLEHNGQTLVFAPSTPVIELPLNGAAADVASPLEFDWAFVDVDPADFQSGYAISRQIGSGTIQYWRASDSTWQASEVNNSTSTTATTLPIGWGADSDAAHTYRVKVWDGSGLASGYSTGVSVIPSAKINPIISYPNTTQTLVLNDTFNRVSADLVGSLPTGLGANAWVGTAGRYDVDGSKARWLSGTNIMRVNSGITGDKATYWEGVTIGTEITGSSYQYYWLTSSDTNTLNMIFVRVSVDSLGNNKVSLFKNVAGVGAEIAFVSNGLPQSASYTIDVSLKVENGVVIATVGPVNIVAFLTTSDIALYSPLGYSGFQASRAMTIDHMYVNSITPQTVTSSDINVSWSVASQKAFRIQLYEVSGDVLVYDSSVITSTTGSFRLPYALKNNTVYRLSLTTTNAEGLTSNVQTITFTVDFVEPSPPAINLTVDNINALVNLTVLNPDPVGAESPASINRVYRRVMGGSGEETLVGTIEGSVPTNLLAAKNFDFESPILSDWVAADPSKSSLDHTVTQAKTEVGSAMQTAITGNGFGGINCTPLTQFSVTPGQSVTLSYWFKAPVTGVNHFGLIGWRTAANVNNSQATSANVVSNGSWQFVTVTGIVPANTAYAFPSCDLSTVANTAGDKSYVDTVTMSIAGFGGTAVEFDDFTVASEISYEYCVETVATNGAAIRSVWFS